MKPPRRVRPQRPAGSNLMPERPRNRFQVVYIVVTALVVCSLLAVGLSLADFGSLFGEDDNGNFIDPNADLIAEQETAVANAPDDVDEILLLANMLGQTGRMREAIPWYERALALKPDDLGIRLDFARSLSGADLMTDAEAQFLAVLAEDADNQAAHYYLAELYLNWDPPRMEDALQHFQQAAEIDPDSFLGDRSRNRVETLEQSTPGASTPQSPTTLTPEAPRTNVLSARYT